MSRSIAVARYEPSQVVERPRVGFIVGPTAVGKSTVALEIAERLGAEIVNADSRQLYRGMDVGTAKPSPAERRRVRHHLIDIATPAAPLDVAEFARRARAVIAGLVAGGRPVLVVGGSGLYLRAIRGGVFEGPAAAPEVRARLAMTAADEGLAGLHRRLAAVDAEAALAISPNDLRRIVRALEVYELTGMPISEHQRRHRFAAREFASLTIGLTLERARLYEAIDRRFDAMIAAGLVDEVRGLLAAGYDPGAPPLCTIGYREIASFLRGETTLVEAVAGAKRASRRLAKRQLTWFRADREIVWLDAATDAAAAGFELFASFFGYREERPR